MVGAVPILPAIIGATFLTRLFYVDVATFCVQEMAVQPEVATFVAYATCWIALELVLELLLGNVTPVGWRRIPTRFDRALGTGLGLAKGTTVLLFASLSVLATTTVPSPPHIAVPSAWILPTARGSFVLAHSLDAARASQSQMERYVVSQAYPSFTPNYNKLPELSAEKKRQVDSVVDAIKMWREVGSSDMYF